MYIGDKKIEDWGIITSFVIGSPSFVKKEYDLPGRHGLIDASEALTGYLVYKNRSVSIDIYIHKKTPEDYQEIYNEIYDYCHGKRRKIIFPFDNDFYYEGRAEVAVKQSDGSHGMVTISADCYPYALKREMTVIDVSSDTTTERQVVLPNAGMPTKLIIETDAEISIKRRGEDITYENGKTTVYAPLLIDPEVVTVSGAANATISYQEGKI